METRSQSLYGNAWDRLQQPAHPAPGINAQYRVFLAALDAGWQMEGAPLLAPTSEAGWVYHCFLHRLPDNEPRLMILPATPEVERLITSARKQKHEEEE